MGYWPVWGDCSGSIQRGSQDCCLVQACTPRMCGCILCFLSRSATEETDSEGSNLDFSTRCARTRGVVEGKLGSSCPSWDEAAAVTGAGTGPEAGKLRWSSLLNWHLDNWLMFSGRTDLDRKVPWVLEVPEPVFFRKERVALMLRGSKCVISQGGDFLSAKAFNNSEIWEQ